MDDAIIAALDIGGQRRQPPGEVPKEAVVEPPYPHLGGADDMAALPASTRHDLEVGDDVHDPKAGDQVSLHRARQQKLEAAGDEVDQKRDLAVPLGAGEPEPVPADEL